MPRLLEDLTGHRFGRLVVLKQSPTRPAYWVCQCDCGALRSVIGGSLRQNKTLSCGCYKTEKRPRKKTKKRRKPKTATPTHDWI